MIQRAVTAIIGVVIGLFATFAVFSAILAGLDSFYLLTQDACNYGSDNSPKRVLRIIAENPERRGEVDDLDWTGGWHRLGQQLRQQTAWPTPIFVHRIRPIWRPTATFSTGRLPARVLGEAIGRHRMD